MELIKHPLNNLIILSLFIVLMSGISSAFAGTEHHRLVIQVSSNDPLTQKIALNNAVNLQKHYGMDNITIEVVAFGPGLGLLTTKSSQAGRVKSLALQDIKFSACSNTMKVMAKKTGKKPELIEGVGQVAAGVARIIGLQEQGYSYIRP